MTRHAPPSVPVPRSRSTLRVASGPRWVGGVLLASLVALSSVADAAKVKGSIANFRQLENPVWRDARSEKKKRGFSFREPVPTVRPELRKLFPHIPKELCIAAISTEKQKPPKPILIRVGGGRTTPVTLVVPPGTHLVFQNTDPFKHRLYGVNVPAFSAADTMRGGNREWTVPGPGVFEIRDKLAPSLRFWVVGEPNVKLSVYPNLKGEFLMQIEEPGDYTLQAFFAGEKVGPATPVKVEQADIEQKEPIKVAPDPKKDDKGKDKDKEKAD